MSNEQTYTLGARIDHLSDGVGCFDPMQVINRMRIVFPEIVESSRDHLWETCDFMRQNTEKGRDGALYIAVRDLQERGPAILFQIPLADGRFAKGVAERYWVHVWSNEEFPADFRRRFTHFLKSLFLQPVETFQGVGDEEVPLAGDGQ